MPAARAADHATHARAALGAASGTLDPGKVSGAARHEGDLGEGCWGPRVLAGRGRGASGSRASTHWLLVGPAGLRGPWWPRAALLASCLSRIADTQDREIWRPWAANLDPLGSGRGQSCGKLPKALALKVFRPCPSRKSARVPPLALSESLPLTDTLGALEPSSPAGARTCQTQLFPDFPNQQCAQSPREAQLWLLWISATVTWK